MKRRSGIVVRGQCAGFHLTRLAAGATVLAAAGNALGLPIDDRGFFGPGATLIDFETRGNGDPVLSGDLDPLMEGESLPLPANEYAPLGVTFDTDIFWVNDGNALFDAAQLLSAMAGQGGSPILAIPSHEISSFELLFTTPAIAFGFFIADNLSEPGRSGVTFEAYDAANALIDTQTFDGAFVDDTISNANTTVAYGFMGISRSDDQNPISRVVITKGAAILDDLVFTPIPAPGAVGMLVAAGLMTIGRRSRREE